MAAPRWGRGLAQRKRGDVAVETTLCGGVAMAAQQRPRYFTPREVAEEARRGRVWVSALGRVFDLEPLLTQRLGDPTLWPLVEALGTDISHWFDPQTGEPVNRVDPQNPFHISFCPPTVPCSAPPALPWWRDPQRQVGLLSKAPRLLRLVDTLTGQEHLLEVCGEETVEDIQQRALPWNANARNCTWRCKGITLNPNLTLEENGIPNDTPELLQPHIDPAEFAPSVLLCFNDNFNRL